MNQPTIAQVLAAKTLVEMAEQDGKPIDEATRRVAEATPAPLRNSNAKHSEASPFELNLSPRFAEQLGARSVIEDLIRAYTTHDSERFYWLRTGTGDAWVRQERRQDDGDFENEVQQALRSPRPV